MARESQPASQPASQPGTTELALRQRHAELAQDIKRSNAQQQGDAITQSVLIKRNLEAANQLHAFVHKPRDHAKDASLFEQLTEQHVEQTRKEAANQHGRTAFDLIQVLRAIYVRGDDPQVDGREDPDAFQWATFAADVSCFFRTAPGMSCMLGPLDAQPKVRKATQQRQRRQNLEAVRPDETDQIVENEKQETDRNMEEMWHVLQQGQGPVAELVCNHRSFAQTVENMFTLAFLVRDGNVQLLHDQHTGLTARFIDKKQEKKKQQTQGGRAPQEEQQQFVVSMTLAEWQHMRSIVREGDCRMRHRQQQDDLIAQQQQRQELQDPGAAGPSSRSAGGSAKRTRVEPGQQ